MAALGQPKAPLDLGQHQDPGIREPAPDPIRGQPATVESEVDGLAGDR
jgi:hypothetical protein